MDSGFVLRGRPGPAGGVDWLLTIFAPDGEIAEKWWPKVITFSGSPVHKTMFDKYVTKATDYPEIADSYKSIANSMIMPVSSGRATPRCRPRVWTWMDRFWAGEIGDKDAVAGRDEGDPGGDGEVGTLAR